MADKKKSAKKAAPATTVMTDEGQTPEKVLTSKQEVADELKMSVYQFNSLLKKYPFAWCGSAGKLNGRWHVAVDDVWRWYRYVQRQEIRHPDARRMRPEEPPALQSIQAR